MSMCGTWIQRHLVGAAAFLLSVQSPQAKLHPGFPMTFTFSSKNDRSSMYVYISLISFVDIPAITVSFDPALCYHCARRLWELIKNCGNGIA